jgi:hypothetical protein
LITVSLASTILSFVVLVAAAEETPQNLWLNITSYTSIVVALIALVGTFVSRKIKSPADELARADFAYKKISERLDEVNKDRTYLQSVIDTLRSQLTKMDTDATLSLEDKRKLRALVEEGEERIRQLVDENQVLNDRLSAIGKKVSLNQPITLADVYGFDDEIIHTPSIAEIEVTVSPQEFAEIRNTVTEGQKE